MSPRPLLAVVAHVPPLERRSQALSAAVPHPRLGNTVAIVSRLPSSTSFWLGTSLRSQTTPGRPVLGRLHLRKRPGPCSSRSHSRVSLEAFSPRATACSTRSVGRGCHHTSKQESRQDLPSPRSRRTCAAWGFIQSAKKPAVPISAIAGAEMQREARAAKAPQRQLSWYACHPQSCPCSHDIRLVHSSWAIRVLVGAGSAPSKPPRPRLLLIPTSQRTRLKPSVDGV